MLKIMRDKWILDDTSVEYLVYGLQCVKCRHLLYERPADGIGSKCVAFERIPIEILRGQHDHINPYPGDGGVQFEPKE